jgi:hypothetical protein
MIIQDRANIAREKLAICAGRKGERYPRSAASTARRAITVIRCAR